jgi:hypothetical protein
MKRRNKVITEVVTHLNDKKDKIVITVGTKILVGDIKVMIVVILNIVTITIITTTTITEDTVVSRRQQIHTLTLL